MPKWLRETIRTRYTTQYRLQGRPVNLFGFFDNFLTIFKFLPQINAKVVEGNNEETVHHAVSFAAQSTYLGLPQMKAYNSINIRLQFRTFEQNGLLFFNAGKASDFIALELVNGRLNYVLNLGYGPISIKDNTSDMVSKIQAGKFEFFIDLLRVFFDFWILKPKCTNEYSTLALKQIFCILIVAISHLS